MGIKMKMFMAALAASLLLFSAAAPAESLSDDELKKRISSVLGQLEITSVKPTPIAGIREIIVGSDVLYATDDGKHVFQGSIYNIENGITDVTEASRSTLRRELMVGVTDDQTIVFGKDDLEDTITVFTDIDCPYCVKLHNEMDQYNAAGIRVRYLFFPRAGIGSPSFAKAVSVWCSDDREGTLTLAKNGAPVDPKTCDNPVQDHYTLGRDVGVTGTPAIMLESGELLPGYIPADKLKTLIKKSKEG
jgi:thiol:disulfide interchange protein DsbC